MSTTAAPPRPPEVDPSVESVADPGQRQTSGRTLVLFGALLAMALMVALPIRTWIAQQSNLDEMHAEIAAAQQRVAELQQQQQQWQDPAYVEGQARLRLNMVKPGESGLIALNRAEQEQVEAVEAPANTWYQKVWRSVDTASGRRATTTSGGGDGD